VKSLIGSLLDYEDRQIRGDMVLAAAPECISVMMGTVGPAPAGASRRNRLAIDTHGRPR